MGRGVRRWGFLAEPGKGLREETQGRCPGPQPVGPTHRITPPTAGETGVEQLDRNQQKHTQKHRFFYMSADQATSGN